MLPRSRDNFYLIITYLPVTQSVKDCEILAKKCPHFALYYII